MFKFIFFKGLIGKKLTYYQPKKSSNRNVSTLNDEFALINQADNSIAIVPDKNKCKEKIESLNESQSEAPKVILKISNYIPYTDSYIFFLSVAYF